jgi:CBS domain-containing protein
MITVRDILDRKGRHVYGVSPGDTVYSALEVMSDRHIGALAVITDGRLVGVVSERDYARKVVLAGRSSRENLQYLQFRSSLFFRAATQRITDLP